MFGTGRGMSIPINTIAWVEPRVAPIITSASVDATGLIVTIPVTSQTIAILPALAITGFSVTSNAVSATISSAVRSANDHVTLTLSSAIFEDAVVLLSYAPGNVTDTHTTALASFSNLAVTNNSEVEAPTVPSTGLVIWLDASAGTYSDTARTTPQTTDTGSVKGWADQSGAGNHVTSTAGQTLNTAVLNGKSVITVNGSDPFLLASDMDLVAGFDFFVVAKNADGANGSVWLGSLTDAPTYLHSNPNGALVTLSLGGSTVSNGLTDGTWGIINAYNDLSNYAITVNGIAPNSAAGGTSFKISGLTYVSGAPQYLPEGYIAEILIYSSKLSAPDRASVLSYLNTKYAVY